MPNNMTVLVTGATGQQGGATARALLAGGHKVRALTRNPDADAARRLAGLGADIVAGDFDDTDSLGRALSGIDTLFLMSTFFETNPETETQRGVRAIEAAQAAGTGHVIFTSVASADRATGIPHFESKGAIERALQASGLPWTILAPVFFMDNHVAPWTLDALAAGRIGHAMPRSRKLQQVAVADIGTFAALLAERRDAVFGRRIDIAGDELTGEETAAVLSQAIGRAVVFEEVPLEALRSMPHGEDVALMYAWFDRVGYSADIAGLRREFPEVGWKSLADWASGVDWRRLAPPAAAAGGR